MFNQNIVHHDLNGYLSFLCTGAVLRLCLPAFSFIYLHFYGVYFSRLSEQYFLFINVRQQKNNV